MAENTGFVISDTEKLLKAREYKDRGNEDYKKGNFRKAAGSYHRALLYLKGLSSNCPDLLSSLSGLPKNKGKSPMTQDLMDDARSLTCDCHNNLAACMLKASAPKYERIIEHCNFALDASPNNIKALYRKGTSLYAIGDYDGALSAFQMAKPDANIRKYMDLCKVELKKQDRAMADNFRGMFDIL
ncbi:tetratricopeptide repeat protein 9C-like [Biomphalaria glabrata]|uniref:Rotamase n=1 Tax=Biomphalaria glabrata TaxID=6526 RepID=A0A9W2ZW27_BIOGL|nr:tetratricopeptide repeat protein 9C-like [Biomphalaria glabrata]XP_055879245.1 tetratricopeptide repeat protein 9C-like [Biomphalaria glabrata]XP_055879247.1 tetratricopeptide repeat protein 9C-like [Biomphalaria glabrata]XP_055879248.1 tetratricopeptide repeat protein 9C-like [Biomphalaria glabrata]KAI8740413.1 tetratricopeptide repeat protein 9C-like [Biomphalaria glabrata]